MTQFESFNSLVDREDIMGAIQAAAVFADSEESLTAFLRDGVTHCMKAVDRFARDGAEIWREHSRSEIIELVLANLRYSVEKCYQRNRKGAAPVVVVCPDGELHDLGAKVTTALLRIKGFNARYVGADLPAGQLISLVASVNPAAVVFSVTHHFNLLAFKDSATKLRQRFPQLMIAAGGMSFSNNKDAFPEVEVIQDHDALFKLIRGEIR